MKVPTNWQLRAASWNPTSFEYMVYLATYVAELIFR